MLTPILSQCALEARELLAHGLIPLPVAPAYPIEQYKSRRGEQLFTGKNPSYITAAGEPETIEKYNKLTATDAADKLDQWFADPRVGVGTCSGQWLDIDLKDFGFDVAAMESAVSSLVERAAWVERTRSGGRGGGNAGTNLNTYININNAFNRPNYNILTPNMRSPEYVQMSTAAAITLGEHAIDISMTRRRDLLGARAVGVHNGRQLHAGQSGQEAGVVPPQVPDADDRDPHAHLTLLQASGRRG